MKDIGDMKNIEEGMKDVDILLDFLAIQQRGVHKELDDAPEALLAYRPDPEANSIGVIVWHFTRLADMVVSGVFHNQEAQGQLWFTSGWAERTGYDPSGKGVNGWGVLTGYSKEEMLEVPAMSRADLLAYFDACYSAMRAYLEGLKGDAGAPAPGLGGDKSVYYWTKLILVDATRHLGQIQYLKAMWSRSQIPA